jgi:hypothetical protein
MYSHRGRNGTKIAGISAMSKYRPGDLEHEIGVFMKIFALLY